jgi:hypothetical protein
MKISYLAIAISVLSIILSIITVAHCQLDARFHAETDVYRTLEYPGYSVSYDLDQDHVGAFVDGFVCGGLKGSGECHRQRQPVPGGLQ